MRLGNKPKLALRITLWALAGIALLALPALLSPAASNNVEAPLIGSTVVPRNLNTLSSQPSQPPASITPTTVNGRDFILRLIVILIPAATLSGFIKNRLDKRMRDVWI